MIEPREAPRLDRNSLASNLSIMNFMTMDGADGKRTTLDKSPKRLMKLFMGHNCFCSALFYRGLKASARELIQIIHKSIHENGNRQQKQNRASIRVDCSFAERGETVC